MADPIREEIRTIVQQELVAFFGRGIGAQIAGATVPSKPGRPPTNGHTNGAHKAEAKAKVKVKVVQSGARQCKAPGCKNKGRGPRFGHVCAEHSHLHTPPSAKATAKAATKKKVSKVVVKRTGKKS